MNEAVLLWINQGWAHPWLDVFFGWISDREWFAYPLAVLLLALAVAQRGRAGWILWGILLVTVGIGDVFGGWLKDLIGQPRPCMDMWEVVRRPGKVPGEPCGGAAYGMPSNHSLNFVVMATYMGLVMRSWKWGVAMGGVAILVAVSRIYLGVHYPAQVVAGAGIGLLIGGFSGWAVRRFMDAPDACPDETVPRRKKSGREPHGAGRDPG